MTAHIAHMSCKATKLTGVNGHIPMTLNIALVSCSGVLMLFALIDTCFVLAIQMHG